MSVLSFKPHRWILDEIAIYDFVDGIEPHQVDKASGTTT